MKRDQSSGRRRGEERGDDDSDDVSGDRLTHLMER
jgi:hypothetical protein